MKGRGLNMTKRKEQYTENLYSKFSALLDRFMDSDTIVWSEKEPVLDDFKEMIDYKKKELHSEDLLM